MLSIFRTRIVVCAFAVLVGAMAAAKEPVQSLNWPNDQNPVLRFTVNNITKMGSYGRQSNYSLDVTVQNLSAKAISRAGCPMFHFGFR